MSDQIDLEGIWGGLPNPAVILDRDHRIVALNPTAEDFFGLSERHLRGRAITRYLGEDSRVLELVDRVFEQGGRAADYDYELAWPDRPPRLVDIMASIADEDGQQVIMLFHPRSIATRMDRSMDHRSAARSVSGMAAMLAHEIKNPLAGISGAAQLLEMNASDSDRELSLLIREEVERIGKLISSFEQFGDLGPIHTQEVNVHDVLDRACRSAKAGFASHVRFIEEYDPSLPPTLGDADSLMQVFMNLLKNAAEATPAVGGVIMLRTSYSAGMKVTTPTGNRESLPLQISITDNGSGISAELLRNIFDPFVTTKTTGSGLGLALVSKVIADHGGVINCDSEPGWTRFSIRLPVAASIRKTTEEAA
ncbi:PAS domain-containing protein [Rhodobacteraceae bacterium NNCM2]|nr:PAS domain-containing protein [Coraliihabitans acroporae]